MRLDCLKHHSERLSKICSCMKSFTKILLLLRGGPQIVNTLTPRAVTRIGIWLARLSIHWHRVMLSPVVMKVSTNSKKGLHFIAENQIFPRSSFFSSTDSRRFLYLFIEYFHLNRMFITSFWFHSKSRLEKTV